MRINTMYICLETESTYTELSAPNILPLAADFPHPVPKVSTIDIIGGNGSLDISDAATGECNFQTVTGTISLVIPDGANVDATIDAVYRKYHGRRCKVKFASAGKYRTGRIWVNADDENRSKRVIKLTMNADPFWISDKTASVTHTDGQDEWDSDMVTLTGARSPVVTADGFRANISRNDVSSYVAEFSMNGNFLMSFNFYKSQIYGDFYFEIYKNGESVRYTSIESGTESGLYCAFSIKQGETVKIKFGLEPWSSYTGNNVIGVQNIKLFSTDGFAVTNGGDVKTIPIVTASGGAATVYAADSQKHFESGESGIFWDFPLSPGINTFGIVPDVSGEHPTLTFAYKEEFL